MKQINIKGVSDKTGLRVERDPMGIVWNLTKQPNGSFKNKICPREWDPQNWLAFKNKNKSSNPG